MKRKEEYRLQLAANPTGSAEEFIAECNTIREGMDRWGLRVLEYDPGVMVCDLANPMAPPADIPLWLLKKMLAALPDPGAPA